MVNRFSNRVLIIDGQGGNMGRQLVEQLLLQSNITLEVTVVGTNAIATAAMLKAGADRGATGENPVLVACRHADIIVGPIGILSADSLMGEITPAMAVAIGQSSARKLLLPVNQCSNLVAGVPPMSLKELMDKAAELLASLL